MNFNTNGFDDAIADVIDERIRQDAKWGFVRDLPAERWLTILTEEVGEFAKDILDHTDYRGNMRDELVQIAAVAIAALQDLDAQSKKVDKW